MDFGTQKLPGTTFYGYQDTAMYIIALFPSLNSGETVQYLGGR